MFGVDVSGLYTFSGLLVIAATVAYVFNRPVWAAALLIVAGAGGSAVAWDRWSERTGEQVHLSAFINLTAPTAGEITTLAMHFPLLVAGLVLLAVSVRQARGG